MNDLTDGERETEVLQITDLRAWTIKVCDGAAREDEAARQATAEAEAVAYADELSGAPRWSLLATLAWIGLRDLRVVASVIVHHPAYYPTFGPSGSYAWLVLELRAMPEVVDAHPMDGLIAALRCGSIRATGRRNAAGGVEAIGPEQWDILAFRDGPSELGEDYAIRDNWMVGGPLGEYWTDVRFDRLSVLDAFSRTPDEASTWQRRGDESLTDWIFRTEPEAKRRAAAEGKGGIYSVIADAYVVMGEECSRPVCKTSVERTMRDWRMLYPAKQRRATP